MLWHFGAFPSIQYSFPEELYINSYSLPTTLIKVSGFNFKIREGPWLAQSIAHVALGSWGREFKSHVWYRIYLIKKIFFNKIK